MGLESGIDNKINEIKEINYENTQDEYKKELRRLAEQQSYGMDIVRELVALQIKYNKNAAEVYDDLDKVAMELEGLSAQKLDSAPTLSSNDNSQDEYEQEVKTIAEFKKLGIDIKYDLMALVIKYNKKAAEAEADIDRALNELEATPLQKSIDLPDTNDIPRSDQPPIIVTGSEKAREVDWIKVPQKDYSREEVETLQNGLSAALTASNNMLARGYKIEELRKKKGFIGYEADFQKFVDSEIARLSEMKFGGDTRYESALESSIQILNELSTIGNFDRASLESMIDERTNKGPRGR